MLTTTDSTRSPRLSCLPPLFPEGTLNCPLTSRIASKNLRITPQRIELRCETEPRCRKTAFGTVEKQPKGTEEDFDKTLNRTVVVIGLTAEPLRQHPVKGKPLRRDMDKRQTRALTQAIPVSNKLEHRQIGGKPDIMRGKAFSPSRPITSDMVLSAIADTIPAGHSLVK